MIKNNATRYVPITHHSLITFCQYDNWQAIILIVIKTEWFLQIKPVGIVENSKGLWIGKVTPTLEAWAEWRQSCQLQQRKEGWCASEIWTIQGYTAISTRVLNIWVAAGKLYSRQTHLVCASGFQSCSSWVQIWDTCMFIPLYSVTTEGKQYPNFSLVLYKISINVFFIYAYIILLYQSKVWTYWACPTGTVYFIDLQFTQRPF